MDHPPWGAFFVPPAPDGPTIARYCENLTVEHQVFLQANPDFPDLYESGVWYQELPEVWVTPDWALYLASLGIGSDCKVLSAWRVAELRERYQEPAARCVWSAHAEPGKLLYHIRVQRGDGSIEDPSALLGMHRALEAKIGVPPWSQLPFRL